MIFRMEMDFPQITKEIPQQWFAFVEQNQDGWQLLGWESAILTNPGSIANTIYEINWKFNIYHLLSSFYSFSSVNRGTISYTFSSVNGGTIFCSTRVITLPDIILTRPPLFPRISLGRTCIGLYHPLALCRFPFLHLKYIWLPSVDRENNKLCH